MAEQESYWIFTFGSGQEHGGYYVKIKGTWQSAREKMFDKYGKAWSWQYTEKEWLDWLFEKPFYVQAEKLLEVIE